MKHIIVAIALALTIAVPLTGAFAGSRIQFPRDLRVFGKRKPPDNVVKLPFLRRGMSEQEIKDAIARRIRLARINKELELDR